MTTDIAAVLTITGAAFVLFLSERLRVDLVALLVLIAVALTGLVTAEQAVSGFANPAVVTVWAVFILSAGLERTGVAGVVGHHVLDLAGVRQWRLVLVIMSAAAVMSAFMNNVGVAALLLPVLMDIARRTGHPPSRLLMPLAYGSLLGGLTTLIGTPPNILVNAALESAAQTDLALQPFGFFAFSRVGIFVAVTGVVFMAAVGRHMLPRRGLVKPRTEMGHYELGEMYDLAERLHVVRVPPDSPLVGSTLAGSRIGAALRLNVIAILRGDETELAPGPGSILREGDRLLVEGSRERIATLKGRRVTIVELEDASVHDLVSTEVGLAEIRLAEHSRVIGRSLRQSNFRHRYGVIVLSFLRDEGPQRTVFHDETLKPGDSLLVQGHRDKLSALARHEDFDLCREVSVDEIEQQFELREHLTRLRVPEGSVLEGRRLVGIRLGDAFGLAALAIYRNGTTGLMPDPDERIQAGDVLLVKGPKEGLDALRNLQGLEIDTGSPPDLRNLESESVGLSEIVLSPHTRLSGQSLRDIHFRDKYGLGVLAIWREGEVYRANLRDMALRFGDALLVYGRRDKLSVLGSDADFLVLTEAAQAPVRKQRAPLAALVMAAVLVPVVAGWLPISIAAVVGAALMVLSGCLTMDEAHRAIQWPVVFLIAGMLPLGIAMEQTGVAAYLADKMVALVGAAGPYAILAGLFIVTAVASQVMPNAAVALLLAPIALSTASSIGVSPYPLLMAVAVSASASFLSPVAHPSNLLVMGPGGYRFSDFLRIGFPLTVVVMVVSLILLPIFWPF